MVIQFPAADFPCKQCRKIYLTAIQKSKPITYIYIPEYPGSDAVMRKRIRNHIADLLPFQLQKLPEVHTELIRAFEVLSIAEWNVRPVNPEILSRLPPLKTQTAQAAVSRSSSAPLPPGYSSPPVSGSLPSASQTAPVPRWYFYQTRRKPVQNHCRSDH